MANYFAQAYSYGTDNDSTYPSLNGIKFNNTGDEVNINTLNCKNSDSVNIMYYVYNSSGYSFYYTIYLETDINNKLYLTLNAKSNIDIISASGEVTLHGKTISYNTFTKRQDNDLITYYLIKRTEITSYNNASDISFSDATAQEFEKTYLGNLQFKSLNFTHEPIMYNKNMITGTSLTNKNFDKGYIRPYCTRPTGLTTLKISNGNNTNLQSNDYIYKNDNISLSGNFTDGINNEVTGFRLVIQDENGNSYFTYIKGTPPLDITNALAECFTNIQQNITIYAKAVGRVNNIPDMERPSKPDSIVYNTKTLTLINLTRPSSNKNTYIYNDSLEQWQAGIPYIYNNVTKQWEQGSAYIL